MKRALTDPVPQPEERAQKRARTKDDLERMYSACAFSSEWSGAPAEALRHVLANANKYGSSLLLVVTADALQVQLTKPNRGAVAMLLLRMPFSCAVRATCELPECASECVVQLPSGLAAAIMASGAAKTFERIALSKSAIASDDYGKRDSIDITMWPAGAMKETTFTPFIQSVSLELFTHEDSAPDAVAHATLSTAAFVEAQRTIDKMYAGVKSSNHALRVAIEPGAIEFALGETLENISKGGKIRFRVGCGDVVEDAQGHGETTVNGTLLAPAVALAAGARRGVLSSPRLFVTESVGGKYGILMTEHAVVSAQDRACRARFYLMPLIAQ